MPALETGVKTSDKGRKQPLFKALAGPWTWQWPLHMDIDWKCLLYWAALALVPCPGFFYCLVGTWASLSLCCIHFARHWAEQCTPLIFTIFLPATGEDQRPLGLWGGEVVRGLQPRKALAWTLRVNYCSHTWRGSPPCPPQLVGEPSLVWPLYDPKKYTDSAWQSFPLIWPCWIPSLHVGRLSGLWIQEGVVHSLLSLLCHSSSHKSLR